MSKQDLLAYIELRQSQIDDLEKRYGTGVRPSWVGEEIMILIHYQRDAEDQLKAMEANNAANHSSN
jgi:hypothetical protein